MIEHVKAFGWIYTSFFSKDEAGTCNALRMDSTKVSALQNQNSLITGLERNLNQATSLKLLKFYSIYYTPS
jgi:hypothetical protein